MAVDVTKVIFIFGLFSRGLSSPVPSVGGVDSIRQNPNAADFISTVHSWTQSNCVLGNRDVNEIILSFSKACIEERESDKYTPILCKYFINTGNELCRLGNQGAQAAHLTVSELSIDLTKLDETFYCKVFSDALAKNMVPVSQFSTNANQEPPWMFKGSGVCQFGCGEDGRKSVCILYAKVLKVLLSSSDTSIGNTIPVPKPTQKANIPGVTTKPSNALVQNSGNVPQIQTTGVPVEEPKEGVGVPGGQPTVGAGKESNIAVSNPGGKPIVDAGGQPTLASEVPGGQPKVTSSIVTPAARVPVGQPTAATGEESKGGVSVQGGQPTADAGQPKVTFSIVTPAAGVPVGQPKAATGEESKVGVGVPGGQPTLAPGIPEGQPKVTPSIPTIGAGIPGGQQAVATGVTERQPKVTSSIQTVAAGGQPTVPEGVTERQPKVDTGVGQPEAGIGGHIQGNGDTNQGGNPTVLITSNPVVQTQGSIGSSPIPITSTTEKNAQEKKDNQQDSWTKIVSTDGYFQGYYDTYLDGDEDYTVEESKNIVNPKAPSKTRKTEYEEEQSSHFMAYFFTIVIVCIIGYILFHNKQKIVAFIVEGKNHGRRGRRPNSKDYNKLETNVSDVMPNVDKGATAQTYIY